jgi:hypothetical protein
MLLIKRILKATSSAKEIGREVAIVNTRAKMTFTIAKVTLKQ